jgi:uncharacterized membrane protein YdcZ (DUF606 family)
MPELIDQGTVQVRPRQWTRTYTIWALIVLSLLPGVAVAMFRDHWLEMPAGVKGAVYLTSAMLIIAAIGLMMRVGDRSPDDS